MSIEELVKQILEGVGGRENVLAATNCMTRLRIDVRDDAEIDEIALKLIPGVMGIVHDKAGNVEVVVGPGKCRKCADECAALGIPASAEVQMQAGHEDSDHASYNDMPKTGHKNPAADKRHASKRASGAPNKAKTTGSGASADNDWKANKAALKAGQKQSKLKGMLKTFGEIFIPLLPGVIAAGICSGFATLLAQLVPAYAENTVLNIIYHLLTLINQSFLTYLTAWGGYRAAEKFGATPILGGMLGMITTLGGIDNIAGAVGMYDAEQPLNSILRSGRGGVLAAVIGVLVLAKVEKWIRRRMPDVLDIVLTPILSILIVLVPYILFIMPATGYISTFLVWIVESVSMSEYLIVRIIAGYISALLFLPMVAMGMHHGLVALYSVQLETLGFVTLYPALAMAGAGQVGAAIAIYQKAKKVGNKRIRSVISGALPAGILGVGEPLIYGVTLPLGKPFITAGLGAGFGGAFAMAMMVGSTTWGPSGVIALAVMTGGPNGPVRSVMYYAIALLISYVMGYLITNFAIKPSEVAEG